MAVTCLPLLNRSGRLRCPLCVTVSVLSSVLCSAHILLGVTLPVQTGCTIDNSQSMSEREEGVVRCSAQSERLH
jgi:hypothetical protein